MVNIFIGLSQHHVVLFQDYLTSKVEFRGKKILITGKRLKKDAHSWDKILLLNQLNNQSKSGFDRIRSIISKIQNYKEVTKELERYKVDKEVNLIFSSLEDVLSNYLFFYFFKNIKGYVIEDGVLNYYNHTNKNVSFSTLLLKKILGKILGLNFKIYKGHTSGIEYDAVVQQYVRAPSLSINPEKSVLLPLKKRSLSFLNNDILIIGQEPYANINSKKYFLKLEILIQRIVNSKEYTKANKIIYKPHRHGPRLNRSFFEENFSNKRVDYITLATSAEDFFFEIAKCRNIFTFDSSTVFNIYLGSDAKTQEELKIFVSPFEENELTEMFENLSFNIFQ